MSADLFNIFLEHLMWKTLEDDTSIENNGVQVNGRIINKFRFADDIDVIGELLNIIQELLDRVE